MKYPVRLILSILLSLALLYGCTQTVNVYQYQYDATLNEVYFKKGVDFSKYNAVMVDGISVWRPKSHVLSTEDAALAQKNMAQAQDLFDETVKNAMSDRYPITKKAGKDVLRIQVEFIDLRALKPGEPLPQELNRLRFKTKPGHITMIARLLDSRTGEQLARAADLGKRENFGSYTLVDWEAIASDFDYWALVFRAWLDKLQPPEA